MFMLPACLHPFLQSKGEVAVTTRRYICLYDTRTGVYDSACFETGDETLRGVLVPQLSGISPCQEGFVLAQHIAFNILRRVPRQAGKGPLDSRC